MKKTIALVSALLMSLALTTVALAATSVNGVAAPEGCTITEITDTKAMEGVKDTAAAVETLAELGIEDAQEYELLSTFDLTGKAGDVKLSIPAAANCEVVLLHYTKGAWEVAYEGTADANGNFSFHVDSFSPFAVMVKGLVSSAKTADATPVALLWGLCLVSLTACACVGRRVRL